MTQRSLLAIEHACSGYLKQWKEAPTSFTELQVFAPDQIPTLDGFGQPWQYIKLSRREFLLRSFGIDAQQNTVLTLPDQVLVNASPPSRVAPIYRYMSDATPHVYPQVVLAGSRSPNQQWHAEVFIDHSSSRRQLLIRHMERHDLFQVAPHDRIDEYLWLPDGYHIVYTASQSQRYPDGLFLWNILDDEVHNLTPQTTDLFDANLNSFYTALAGIQLRPLRIFVHLAPGNTGLLDPNRFFSAETLFSVTLDASNPRQVIKPLARIPSNQPPTLTRSWSPKHQVFGTDSPELSPLVTQWLSLAMEGKGQSILESWQAFSSAHTKSTLFPYSLWILASIYNDSYVLLAKDSEKDANVLRSYGSELAGSLASTHTAPSYLRAFGSHIEASLLEGRPLGYEISKLRF